MNLPDNTKSSISDRSVGLNVLRHSRRLIVRSSGGQYGTLRCSGRSSLDQRHRDTHGDPRLPCGATNGRHQNTSIGVSDSWRKDTQSPSHWLSRKWCSLPWVLSTKHWSHVSTNFYCTLSPATFCTLFLELRMKEYEFTVSWTKN